MTNIEDIIWAIITSKKPRVHEKALNETREQSEIYCPEFDAIYNRRISPELSEEAIKIFVNWANKQKIDDYNRVITDGMSFYQLLIQEAQKKYLRFIKEGYEPESAFDKSISTLIQWLERSTNEGTGTIFINYPPASYHRLRHMMED